MPDIDQEKIGQEKALRIERQIGFAAGLFQEDVTVRTLLESLAEGVVVIDSSGAILLVNARAGQMFGYSKQELIGKPHSVLIPECFREVYEEHVAQYFEAPRIGRTGQFLELSGLRRDGGEFPLEMSLSFIETINGVLVLALVSDITLRKRAEEAVRIEKDRAQNYLEIAAVILIVINADGIVSLINKKGCEILGYEKEEIIGKDWFDNFIPDPVRKEVRDVFRSIMKGEAELFEYVESTLLTRNGEERLIAWKNTILQEETGETVATLSSGEDITERKRTENALLESEERFHTLANNIPQLCWMANPDGGIFWYNKRWYEYTGTTLDQMTGWGWQSVHDPEMLPQILERWKGSIATGKPFDMVLPLRGSDGIFRPFLTRVMPVSDHDGKIVRWFGTNTDITDQKLAEAALRESEERFRLLADAAPVLIWEGGPDAHCTFFNKHWLEYTGRNLDQELGDGWTQGVHPDDVEHCKDTYLSAVKDRRSFSMEYRLRRSDGEYGWVAVTGVPRLTTGGDLFGYIGSGFDVTEKKRAQEVLKQANELLQQRVEERTKELSDAIEKLKNEINERRSVQDELREKELLMIQQSRLAAMGEMIGNIAHQWRQPLNMLGLLAQDLAMTYKKGDFSTQYLEANVQKVMETINHMSKTIDDFRNFFRPDKQKTDFRILEIIEKTVSLLEGSLKAKQIRTAVVAASDPVVNGYPNEFSQVILNIMINARDAFVTQHVTGPAITIEIGTEEGRCVVTITDNAGGIPEEIIDKIFNPYFTTKGPDQGTGVGLYMSKMIIEENMGGTLSACNVDGGAQFRIEV